MSWNNTASLKLMTPCSFQEQLMYAEIYLCHGEDFADQTLLPFEVLVI